MRTVTLTVALLLAAGLCSGAEIFSLDCEGLPLGALNNGTPGHPFSDVNNYGSAVTIIDELSHSGSQSIRISYDANEDGVELKVPEFSAQDTTTLYTRKFERYGDEWSGNWPIGLKTSRYFTNTSYNTGAPSPNANAYMSEKFIWQTYASDCTEDFVYGLNSAIYNLDLVDAYEPWELFGNGLPYIRPGHWYKYETWMVLNSAVDVPDGVLNVWIDDVLVYSNEAVVWRSTARGCPNGTSWQSMWFGGNYSGAHCGDPSTALHRYLDDLYVSTTLDRDLLFMDGFEAGDTRAWEQTTTRR